MNCPKCGHKSYVSNSIDKSYFVKRYRICSNKRCKYRFSTTEMIKEDWNYRDLVMKVLKVLDGVTYKPRK